MSVHYAADLETIENIFRILVSANQVSLHGAIAEMCEEYETLHERTGRPLVVGQSTSSLVLSVIKTEVPLDCDDQTIKDLLLQQCGERIEKLSQQDKLSKFCMNTGFLNIVEIGQYFIDTQRDTKRTKRRRDREEKERNFGAVHPSGPHPSGPVVQFWPIRFWPSCFASQLWPVRFGLSCFTGQLWPVRFWPKLFF